MRNRSCLSMLAIMMMFAPAAVMLAPAAVGAETKTVGDFALLDQKGLFHQLGKYADHKALVVFIQGNGCPIVRLAVPTLTKIRDDFRDKGVEVVMLNANIQDDLKSIREEAKEFAMDFPILKDETQLVAEMLGVVRTGEVFVIKPETKEIVYRGAIDNRIGYESQRDAATANYLVDALNTTLAGKPVEPAVREAKGCIVSFPNKSKDDHREISYSKEVAKILETRCVDCHIQGGIGPFAMSNHKAVQGWSAMIAETVMTNRMPPGQIDMEHGQWKDVHFVTPEERITLIHWINAGAKHDGGDDPLAAIKPLPPGHWHLGEPDLIVELPPYEVPATGVLPQPSVTIPLNLTEERWVRAYEHNIEHRDVCHHITSSMVILNDGSRPAARRPRPESQEIGDITVVDADDPDAADPRAARSQGFAGYAPGKPIGIYPDGVGYRVVPNMAWRASLHYTTSGKAKVDHSKLGLYFYPKDQPPKYEIKRWSAGTNRFTIPPEIADYPVAGVGTVNVDSYLYNMQPHMHYRGKRVTYTAHFPDGTSQVLLNVPNYSYLWQMIYTPEKPIFLPAGTKVAVEGAFDNSAMNPHNPAPEEEVRPGAQTWQEMFIGHMQVGPANPDQQNAPYTRSR